MPQSIRRYAGAYRRFCLQGAVLFSLAVVGVLAVRATPWSPRIRRLPVATCLAHPERCRGDDVFIVGSYAPGSLRSSSDCAAEFELQSPGGVSKAKLAVCSDPNLPPSIESASYCRQDPRMRLVVANGYYTIMARGRLVGSVFRATQLLGSAGCDWKLAVMRYGDVAVRDRL